MRVAKTLWSPWTHLASHEVESVFPPKTALIGHFFQILFQRDIFQNVQRWARCKFTKRLNNMQATKQGSKAMDYFVFIKQTHNSLSEADRFRWYKYKWKCKYKWKRVSISQTDKSSERQTRLLCLNETRDSSKRGMGKCYMAHVNIYVCVFQIHIYTHRYRYRKYKYYIYRFT